MDIWTQLVEARIRDWRERVERGEVKQDAAPLKVDSFESQLFKEIVRLRLEAHAQSDKAARDALMSKANGLRIQLMINLERDRPLLARTLDARIYELSRPPED